MAKTVKVESSMEVRNAAQTVQAREIIKEEISVNNVSHFLPQTVPPSTANLSIAFGGVTQGKRIWLSTSQEVTLKINNLLDTGFPFGPGSGYLPSNTGITGLWITTGANETEVSALITGA